MFLRFLRIFLVCLGLLFSPRATASEDESAESDNVHVDAHEASQAPLHLGFDASIKPRIMAHALANWMPFHSRLRWLGLNFSGRTAYAQEEGLYNAALAGPAFRLGKNIHYWTLAPSAGFEKSEEDWAFRTGLVITFTSDRLELASVFEHGVETGPWYSAVINWWPEAAGPIGIGAFAQRLEGMGPWVGARFWKLSIGIAPVYDPETTDRGAILTFEFQRH